MWVNVVPPAYNGKEVRCLRVDNVDVLRGASPDDGADEELYEYSVETKRVRLERFDVGCASAYAAK